MPLTRNPEKPAWAGWLGLLIMTWMAMLPSSGFAQDLRIFAPTELKFLLTDLTEQFQATHPQRVSVEYESSGALFGKIKNGESVDLFFSSDLRYPQRLQDTGEAEPGTLYRYGVSSLVLWVAKASPLDLEHQQMQVLLDAAVHKIAVPDPSLVPPGKSAFAALRHFQIDEAIRKKIVLTDTSWMAARYVESGAAEVAILPLSLASAPTMRAGGRFWELPRTSYPVLEVSSVLLRDSPHRDVARAFLLYINSKAGREVMQLYGFLTPR
jgi:molybdate transport system substrate-binding protein